MIGNALLVLSLVAYVMMSRTRFFKYNTVDKILAVKSLQQQLEIAGGPSRHSNEPNFKTVLNKMWMYGFTEWLVFVVTLSVYPSVTVLINSERRGNGHPWNDVYFVPVTNYLIFNSGDYLGRILAGLIEWVSVKMHSFKKIRCYKTDF